MIEETMDWLQPESLETLYEIIEQNHAHHQWSGIIFTGSEVTLWPDLPRFADIARKNGFQNVRIQTHGMRLADKSYADSLVAAGINEFFISITAADAATHDTITQVPGSFDRTMAAFELLDQIDDITLISNTVITSQSYQQLGGIVDNLAMLNSLVQMEFWNYWPMNEEDTKDLIVSHLELLPFLQEAIVRARRNGRHVEVKNFPECILGDLADVLNNNQPKLFIDDKFWPEFMRNGFHQCVYKDECSSTNCLGLNTAYVNKYGWHEDDLIPYPQNESCTDAS